VRSWGHVRLFSFWRYNMDEVAKGLLREHGWQEPQEDGLPTGNELCDAYLEPLAEIPAIGGAIETKTRVRAITRQGIDKVTSRNRAKHPFALTVENQGARKVSEVPHGSLSEKREGCPSTTWPARSALVAIASRWAGSAAIISTLAKPVVGPVRTGAPRLFQVLAAR
jgi:hypothetical protein